MCTCMRARPTASSCQPVTGCRPSCGQAACRRQLPARLITQADLATLTEKVRRHGPRQTTLPRHLATPKAKLMTRVGEEFPFACPGCGRDIRLIADGRQEPAYFEPEVRKREKARMALPA
jgi:hypothetical protein